MSVREMFYSEDREFSDAEEKLMAREDLVYNITEDILVALEKLGINKKEFARRLSKSQSHVTQLLSGARNMTLGTLSDISYVLGADLKVSMKLNCRTIRASDWHEITNVPEKPYLVSSIHRIQTGTKTHWQTTPETKVAANG